MLSVAKADLTESVGTVMEGIQLSQLNRQQLAALVNKRGVAFFRDQDLTTKKQVDLFEQYRIFGQISGSEGTLSRS